MTDKFVVLPMNIFITGASSGIGEFVAYEYSRRGATIALCARRKEKLENIAQKCESLGAKIHTPILSMSQINIQQKSQLKTF